MPVGAVARHAVGTREEIDEEPERDEQRADGNELRLGEAHGDDGIDAKEGDEEARDGIEQQVEPEEHAGAGKPAPAGRAGARR